MSFSAPPARYLSDDNLQALRRQAHDELALAIGSYSGARTENSAKLYAFARPIAVYVVHGLLSECEVRARFFDAARDKGDIEKFGAPWAAKTVRSALVAAIADPLPPLQPAYRAEAASA